MDLIVIAMLAIASLFLFINFVFALIVIIKMFKNDQTGMGIACLVMSFLCFGMGMPVAFVFGWLKAGEWKIKGLMMGWTGFGVLSFFVILCLGISTQVLGTKASATFTTVGHTIGR